EVPADASPAQRLARRRDLSFLAAVSWLRGLEARPRDGSLLVDKAVDALEESLDADAAFAPAAALFGLVLQYLGDTERSLELLDVAQRRGLTSPAMGVALAAEYVRAGRLVEAKRIFFEQLAGGRRNAGAARRLRELLVIERT
ncbi:hypothetical protein, partial [Cronobacter sakazakii]|uniref:hypothetical protein n=1 Tax=Cronobacter sakazakii TaxID=28141 RepID=UPI0014833860